MVAWDRFWARGRSSGLYINFHSDGRTKDVLEHFSLSSLLRPALAQATPLKNKLLERQKLVAFSLISFRVVQASTGSSSALEKNSTVSFRLRNSDWWKVISSFSNGKSSGSVYHHFLLTTLFSSREIRVESKWSLVDYKRRVSPSATIQAAYYISFKNSVNLSLKSERITTVGGNVKETHLGSSYYAKNLGHLGLAAGGQMYDALDFRLFIVYFNQILSECRKYTATRTRTPLGYGAVVISILRLPKLLAKY